MSTSCHSSRHLWDKKYISIYQVKCEGTHHFLKKIAKNGKAAGVCKKINLRLESVKTKNVRNQSFRKFPAMYYQQNRELAQPSRVQ